jgi:hypothetical protein
MFGGLRKKFAASLVQYVQIFSDIVNPEQQHQYAILKKFWLYFNVSDLDPGSGAFLTPGSGNRNGKNLIRDPGKTSRIRNTALFIVYISCAFDPGIGMEIAWAWPS